MRPSAFNGLLGDYSLFCEFASLPRRLAEPNLNSKGRKRGTERHVVSRFQTLIDVWSESGG